MTATPAVVGNTVYFPDFAGDFYAVNADTGALIWSQKVSTWTSVPNDYARDNPAFDNQTLLWAIKQARAPLGRLRADWLAMGRRSWPSTPPPAP